MTQDFYRPQWHFRSERNWINDPNGPIWYQGYYHLFYQYNPHSPYWGDMHWGHTRSRDLIHWEHLPVALAPDGFHGEKHCFSGCAVLNGETPAILYTSIGEGSRGARLGAEQRLAVSHDGMITWERSQKDPVITGEIHKGEQIREWRDPFVWRENDGWHLLLGGSRNGYGCVLLYRSDNLYDWRYAGILYETRDYPFLECPNLLTFGETKVLLYSPNRSVRYHIGRIENDRFVTQAEGILDSSGRSGFYACNTLLNDPKGRYITWGWLTEEAKGGLQLSDCTCALSLPRVLSLRENKLCQAPAEELKTLRRPPEKLQSEPLSGELVFSGYSRSFEIKLDAQVCASDDFYLHVLETPDHSESTSVHYCAGTGYLTLEKGRTSLSDEPSKMFQRAKLEPGTGRLNLHVFVDYSTIEIFANYQEAISGRLYPICKNADGVRITGTASSLSATMWRLKEAKPTFAHLRKGHNP